MLIPISEEGTRKLDHTLIDDCEGFLKTREERGHMNNRILSLWKPSYEE